eukprot:g15871.t1
MGLTYTKDGQTYTLLQLVGLDVGEDAELGALKMLACNAIQQASELEMTAEQKTQHASFLLEVAGGMKGLNAAILQLSTNKVATETLKMRSLSLDHGRATMCLEIVSQAFVNLMATKLENAMENKKITDITQMRSLKVLLNLPDGFLDFPYVREAIAIIAKVRTEEDAHNLCRSFMKMEKNFVTELTTVITNALSAYAAGRNAVDCLRPASPDASVDGASDGAESSISTSTTSTKKKSTTAMKKKATRGGKKGRDQLQTIGEDETTVLTSENLEKLAPAPGGKRTLELRSPGAASSSVSSAKLLKSATGLPLGGAMPLSYASTTELSDAAAQLRQMRVPILEAPVNVATLFDDIARTDRGRILREYKEALAHWAPSACLLI